MNDTYTMTVDLNVLEHLGMNLYSNIAAVLTEAVANSWDADAENVDIKIDADSKRIEITDDGVGMSIDDMNTKYLRVGYRRRQEDRKHGKRTAKGRTVMGRKGLGKLSLFSIADVIELQSAKDGQSHGLRMSVEGIQESVRRKEQHYQPEPLREEEVTITKGTRIVLKSVKRQRLGKGAAALRKRLARRFSVIGEWHNFIVTIDCSPVTTADRGDLPMVQFLWAFGGFEPDDASIPNVLERETLCDKVEKWNDDWSVAGWIGTAARPKQLDSDEAGNLNSIVVFARGRLVHENILDKVNDGRLYTKYLTGQIEADFLDTDDAADIATSDRQRLQEDDPRYIELVSFLRASFTRVERRWTQWRRKHEGKKAKAASPALVEWLDSLPMGYRDNAETMIANLSGIPIDNEDDKKLMYRHGILAFERMRLRGSTDVLATHIGNVDKLLELLADRDALEAALYRDIVKTRLDAIEKFRGIVDEDSKERVLHLYLFNHLWLLDPGWERATGSALMESRLTELGVLTDDETNKDKLSRVDIAYRTNAGKHIIVELKRVSRKIKLIELQEQGQSYVDKLKRILLNQGQSSSDIEVVFVLGKPVDEEQDNPDRVKASMTAVSPGSRIVHYDGLIKGALDSYSEYLDKSHQLDRLEEIVNRI